MYLLDVSIRDLKYFCVLFVLFVFLFMLLALLRCYTSIFDGFISWSIGSLSIPHVSEINCIQSHLFVQYGPNHKQSREGSMEQWLVSQQGELAPSGRTWEAAAL